MNDDVTHGSPIPDDFEDGLEQEIESWLASQPQPLSPEEKEALHLAVHPVAEEFVARYFHDGPDKLDEGMGRPEKQFLNCVAQIVVGYALSPEEIAVITEHMQWAFGWVAFAGWQARRKTSDGTLDIPERP